MGNKNAVGNSGGGAPEGNKNAAGFGAPYGNQNGKRHGLYCKNQVYIPYTPENLLVFEAMKKDGIDFDVWGIHKLFNNYKKMLKPQIRELQKQRENRKRKKHRKMTLERGE